MSDELAPSHYKAIIMRMERQPNRFLDPGQTPHQGNMESYVDQFTRAIRWQTNQRSYFNMKSLTLLHFDYFNNELGTKQKASTKQR